MDFGWYILPSPPRMRQVNVQVWKPSFVETKLFTGRLPPLFTYIAGALLHPSWTGTAKTVHKSVNKATHPASHTTATRGNSSLSSSWPSALSSKLQVCFNIN